jgi:Domain of unknown function DUF11/Putative binding domain, N-terminal
MKLSSAVSAGLSVFSLCLATAVAVAQSAKPVRPSLPDPCADNAGLSVRIHASSASVKTLSLCDGYALTGGAASTSARPLSLAKGDFDEDGVDDLVSGYGSGEGGSIVLHRGNIAALWPYGESLRIGPPAPFLPGARRFAVPEAPDFLAAGDFDADGHQDVVIAHRGSDAMYFIRGDGHGGFAPAKRIAVGGSITVMISGEINRRDGLPDLILGLNTAQGARVLIFESPKGAVQAQPEVFRMPEPVTALALGRFTGGAMIDLAVGAGDQLVLIEGRDRRLSQSPARQAAVAPARLTAQRLGYDIRALEGGDFTGAGPSLAVLGDDGRVHIMERAVVNSSLLGKALDDPKFVPTMRVANLANNGAQLPLAGHLTPSQMQRLSSIRELASAAGGLQAWTEQSVVALPAGFAQSTPFLKAGRVSGSLHDDLLVPDSGDGQLHVLSVPRGKATLSAVMRPEMRLLASLDAEAAPTAVLPMRLNQFGLQGLVLLQSGQDSPTVMPQTIPPANIFTVTNTSDSVIAVGPEYTGPAGSLRAAMYNVQNAASTNGGGSYEIVFNIPTSDPGYSATDGSFLIQPLSEAAPGALNNFALAPINATVTIDGYTQPGASPNTLANGDNAKILIRIDGALATTPGGSGLVPFDDANSTYRGMDFTGWTNPDVSSGTASGAMGIEANGVGDYIEGNFFGTDPTGTLATNPKTSVSYGNRIGVFGDNGPAFGNMDGGTIVGGTTPQARNILSNNTVGGVLYLSTAYESHLEGNFIGLDATGAKALPNTDDGAGSNGPTVTIGGTLPGDGNVISSNGTNVDFNDITNGGQASNSTVEGNLIGTDVTGTVSISAGYGTGMSIYSGPTDETVGGTTPAARNVISGNDFGVYIFNSTTGNVIQGNYIGTDVTGTKALGNAQQGLLQGATDSTSVPATNSVIGGATPGAGNLISGNTLDGISISGTTLGGTYGDTPEGSSIEGNLIGTDVTGTKALPNGATGISLLAEASNNVIGGSNLGAANTISFNTTDGVHIDSSSGGYGNGNTTVGNIITNNGGAGVRVNSGAGELISRNSVYQNGDLGIALGTGGPNINTPCQSSTSGPNDVQNAPVLTAGTGAAFITATATDPNGNTSEFSNAVAATATGDMVSLLGSFNSLPNTTYTIEFFSSPTADPSGYGQGQTYLGSTTITTGSTCTQTISNPVNTDDADMSITLGNGNAYEWQSGPDFGTQVYTASVENLGPATATSVQVQDVLPASLAISSLYCNLGPCQSAVTTSLGACTVTGQTVTCNLGTMAAGQTATVNIPVQVLTPGSIADTATVSATQTDPNLANNTSSVTTTATYPEPFIDYPPNSTQPTIIPDSAIAGSSDLPITVYGEGFIPSTAVTFNGTPLPTVSFVDNQLCSEFPTYYCAGINVVVPAALLTTAQTATISVSNPNPGPGDTTNTPSTGPFTIASACTFSDISEFPTLPSTIENDGTTLIADTVEVDANAPSCSWTASSSVAWVVPLESTTQTGEVASIDFAVAPNSGSSPRSGSVTVAGQTFSFQQDAGSTCDYTLGSASANFTTAGGAGSVSVTPNSSSCSPFVVSYAPWITVPESSGLLINNAPATFTVAANTGAPRTGNIMIGGYVFAVNQASPPCYYTLSPGTAVWGAAGGSGSFTVTTSSPSCAWTATSSSPSEVSITSGASGSGSGTVSYSVAANTSGVQTPTITVADTNGGSSAFSITQASDYSCTFPLSPSSVEVSADGTSNFFAVNASNSFCNWTATSNNPGALSVTENPSGQGIGTVYYAVAQNTSPQPRTLTITAGCETFTVNQDGAAATNNPVPAVTSLMPSSATAGSGQFTLTVNGSNFVSGATVSFNGTAETTTFVSASQLTASIPASAIATAGNVPVLVTNPTPGGGPSNTLTFSIVSATSTATLTGITFGNQTEGVTSAAMTATLTNTSTSNSLSITGITITGTNAADFKVTTGSGACGTTLAANTSCPIYITFTPGTTAAESATLNVADNATGSPQTAALTGTGVAAVPTATLTGISFGNQTEGVASAAMTATLTNTSSTASLSITSITSTGANAADFTITTGSGACSATTAVAAGKTCLIYVTFKPSTAAAESATLSVADNATGSPQTAALTGTGVAAVPTATLTGISFGSITDGTTSAAMTATLTNTSSTASLSITSITSTGANAADFTITTGSGACSTTTSVAAGKTCLIYVTFKPSTAAAESATLSVADNATGSPQTATLAGTGTAPPAPAVTLSPTSVAFGNQEVNTTSAAQTVTVTNSGTATLSISSIYLNEPSEDDVAKARAAAKAHPAQLTIQSSADFAATTTCGSTLAAGANCTISVTFDPSTTGSLPGTLGLQDNASSSPQTVSLSGTGVTGGSFTIASPTPPQTVKAGGSAQYTINVAVTPSGDIFPNQVTLTATGLPPGATATFSPPQVIPGTGMVSSNMTVQTSTQASLLAPFSHGTRWPVVPSSFALACCAAWAGFRRKRRERFSRYLALILLLISMGAATFGLMGCGAGFAQIQPKTYTITVTGTSGAATASTTVQLTVE